LAFAAFGLAAFAGFGLAAADFDFPASAFAEAAPLAAGALAVVADREADGFAVDDLAVAGLAADGLAVAAADLAVVGLAFAVDDFAVDGFAVDFADAVERLAPAARTVRADVAARAVVVLAAPLVLDRAEVLVAGIAVDIALAASVSDLTAVCIALVAVLIACSAVVIVLAEDVAFVAAVFSCAAADVTLVAAEFTDRAVVAAELVVRLAVAGRAALFLAVPALADVRRAVLLADVRRAVLLAAGLAAARVAVFFAAVGDLAELVRLALAVRGRVGFVAAGVVGTDLPPSGSVTGSLIPRSAKFYTSAPLEHHKSPWSGRGDSNSRSLDPQSSALTKLGHVPKLRNLGSPPTLAHPGHHQETRTTSRQSTVAPVR
jgi:hypothetical protein